MRITVHHAQAMTAGITDVRPLGVLPPLPVRPSATRRAHAALTRSLSAGPVLRRRPQIAPSRSRTALPVASDGDAVVVTVVQPPRHGAGGGPRARPATISH